MLELAAEPVDEGLVAVVRVVWALLLPLPVADPALVVASVVLAEITEEDPAVAVVLMDSSLLATLVAAAEEEEEGVVVLVETVLERLLLLLLLTIEVVPASLPALILKGKLYWKMVVSESSWSFKPYVAYPAMSLSGVHVYVPRALSMLAIYGGLSADPSARPSLRGEEWKRTEKKRALTRNVGTGVEIESTFRGTLEKQDGHVLPVVLSCGIPGDLVRLLPIRHEFLIFGRNGDCIEVRRLRESRAQEGQECSGDGELHFV